MRGRLSKAASIILRWILEVDGTDSGLCPVAGFSINDTEPVSSIGRECVSYFFTFLLQDQEETSLGF
jgi:hypothetical protein